MDIYREEIIMKPQAFRLTNGTDLRKGIEEYCQTHGIISGCIVTAVGSLYPARMRMARGDVIKDFTDHYEITSLTGTVSADGVHLHITISDEDGKAYGGHLVYGCTVNTTAEIILLSLDDEYSFTREFDESTGYKELVITEK